MTSDTEEKLLGVFKKIFSFDDDQSARASTIENTPDWDSFNGLNVVLEIEDQFNLSLSMAELNRCVSFQAILCVIEKRVND